jgi:hypothetical protein
MEYKQDQNFDQKCFCGPFLSSQDAESFLLDLLETNFGKSVTDFEILKM